MMRKTASIKPTKVTLEDIELADEISLVASIKEAVGTFITLFDEEFNGLETIADSGNAVAVYKQIISAREALRENVNFLQARLLVGLGDIEPEDAKELSDPAAAQTAGTMDAALADPADVTRADNDPYHIDKYLTDVDEPSGEPNHLSNTESLDIEIHEES